MVQLLVWAARVIRITLILNFKEDRENNGSFNQHTTVNICPCVKTFCEARFVPLYLNFVFELWPTHWIYWRIVWGRCGCEWSRWVKCGVTWTGVADDKRGLADDNVFVDLLDWMIAAFATCSNVIAWQTVSSNITISMPFCGAQSYPFILFKFIVILTRVSLTGWLLWLHSVNDVYNRHCNDWCQTDMSIFSIPVLSNVHGQPSHALNYKLRY